MTLHSFFLTQSRIKELPDFTEKKIKNGQYFVDETT